MIKPFETKRFYLRPLNLGDLRDMFELDVNSEVHRFLGNKPVTHLAQVRQNLEDIMSQYSRHGIGRWAVIDKLTGDFLGWSGLKYEYEPGYGHYYDIGYRLKEQFWGKGIGSETAMAWLKCGFDQLKLKSISGIAHIGNHASNRILRKIGLQFQNHFYWEDILCNWYTLNEKDYRKV